MKLRLAPALGADRRRPPERPVLHPRRRRPRRHRRAHPPPRPRDLRPAAGARAAAGPRRRRTSATRRCATAARSAARSPTPTRRPTCRPRPWRSARPTWRRARTASARSRPATSSQGFLESALAPDELLTEIRVPKMAGAGWCFQKFNRRAQDWAIVGVAAWRRNGDSGVGAGQHGLHADPRDERVVGALAGGASVGRRRRAGRRRGRAAGRPQRQRRVPHRTSPRSSCAAPSRRPRRPRRAFTGRLRTHR